MESLDGLPIVASGPRILGCRLRWGVFSTSLDGSSCAYVEITYGVFGIIRSVYWKVTFWVGRIWGSRLPGSCPLQNQKQQLGGEGRPATETVSSNN